MWSPAGTWREKLPCGLAQYLTSSSFHKTKPTQTKILSSFFYYYILFALGHYQTLISNFWHLTRVSELLLSIQEARLCAADALNCSWLWKWKGQTSPCRAREGTPTHWLGDSPSNSNTEGHRHNKPPTQDHLPVLPYFLSQGFTATYTAGCWNTDLMTTLLALLCLDRSLMTPWIIFSIHFKNLGVTGFFSLTMRFPKHSGVCLGSNHQNKLVTTSTSCHLRNEQHQAELMPFPS